MLLEGLGNFEKYNDFIGNRTRDRPVHSIYGTSIGGTINFDSCSLMTKGADAVSYVIDLL
jgi:hypothetical protein